VIRSGKIIKNTFVPSKHGKVIKIVKVKARKLILNGATRSLLLAAKEEKATK
jgi:hypothetical protein